MSEPDFLSNRRLAIVGLGLMGGSLAMAFHGKCASLMGIDTDPQALSLARQWKLVDQVSSRPEELLPYADMVILATPVRTILSLLQELPTLHPGAAVVLDLGSTKVEITKAMQSLPARFDPVGGHPMCGKERSSLENADPKLFQGHRFAFTPLTRTSPIAHTLVTQLAQALGALPLWIDPDTHDRWVAATSHLPYLIANALSFVTPAEARPLVGPGFRGASRLAASSPEMMLDILATNRSNILTSLQHFCKRLESMEASLVEGEFNTLHDQLSRGAVNYEVLISSEKVE